MPTAKVKGSQTVTRARKGQNGKGIVSQTDYYAVSSSATTAPTSWTANTPPAFTDTNKYLWKYTHTVYSDGSYTDTTPGVVGVKGDAGLSYRYSKWAAGVEYRNDNNPFYRDSQGRGIVDVVYRDDITIWDPATDPNNPPDVFLCLKTHTSGNTTVAAQNIYALPSSGQSNAAWSAYNSMKPIVTALVLANKIKANAIDVGNLSADESFITNLVAQTAFINELNTKSLKAKEIVTENNNGFLQMLGNILQMFNSSGDERLKIHGGSLSSISTTTYSDPSTYKSCYAGGLFYSAYQSVNEFSSETTIATRTISDNMILSLPQVSMNISAALTRSMGSGPDLYFMGIAQYFVDDMQVAYNSRPIMATTISPSPSETMILPATKVNVGSGSHTIKVKVSIMFLNQTQLPSGDDVQVSIGGSISANTIVWATSIQKVEIANNGFRVALASNVYFTVYLSGGYNYIQMMNENYGLRITNTGIQKTTNGGSTWTSL